ncbi:MAG: YitT family protein [Paraprevotella sp.]|nr:YitT family protein [Paraprevotella sp.]
MYTLKFNLWQETKDYLFIFLGLLCYSIGFTCFMLPYQITTGGLAGVASIIFYATKIPVQYSYLTLNGILLIAAIKILGFRFCLKTIIAVLTLTFLLGFMQELVQDSEGNLPRILGNETFMACVIGGCLEGIGLAIVFLNNGSTGGTDIIAAIVNKYRDVTMGRMLMYCDIIIVSSCYIVFHDWQKVVMGFSTLIISNLMLDYVMNSARQSVQFLIFSNKYNEIAEVISKEVGRGITVLDGAGWYSKEPRKVLVILAKRRESVYIFRLINQIDPKAFVSQSNVVGVYGEGFDKIKVK